MSFDDYKPGAVIGRGSFGTVQLVTHRPTGAQRCWKALDYGRMNQKEKELLVGEVNILRRLDHRHIVEYYDRIIDKSESKIYIVMEYCGGGDLAGRIKDLKRNKMYEDPEFVWKVLAQSIMALDDCHTKKETILHRDVKPGNIFLDTEKNVKLGDFGLARELGTDSVYAKTYVGTPFYMSPEQIDGKGYTEKCDIWALGCVIYELCALYPPFPAATKKELDDKIRRGRFDLTPLQRHFGPELSEIVASMMTADSRARPSTRTLLANRHIALRVREMNVAARHKQLESWAVQLKEWERKVKEREKSVAEAESMAKGQPSAAAGGVACSSTSVSISGASLSGAGAVAASVAGTSHGMRPRAPSYGRLPAGNGETVSRLPPRQTERTTTGGKENVLRDRDDPQIQMPSRPRAPSQTKVGGAGRPEPHRPRYALRRYGSEPQLGV